MKFMAKEENFSRIIQEKYTTLKKMKIIEPQNGLEPLSNDRIILQAHDLCKIFNKENPENGLNHLFIYLIFEEIEELKALSLENLRSKRLSTLI